MNPDQFSAIAHRDHDYCNPIAAAKIERVLDLMELDASSLVLDLGCGRAELALRIIERFGSTVVAVERSSYMLDAARERAQWTGALARLHLDDIDIRAFRADPETFQLSVMLGAGGIDGGTGGICRALAGWTRPGGYVLVGEGYWKQRPAPEYLALLGGDASQYVDHHGNVQAGIDAGLIPLARGDRERRRVGRVRVEVRARDRALRRRATGRSAGPRDARARAPLARRLPALGARHARVRPLPLLPAGRARYGSVAGLIFSSASASSSHVVSCRASSQAIAPARSCAGLSFSFASSRVGLGRGEPGVEVALLGLERRHRGLELRLLREERLARVGDLLPRLRLLALERLAIGCVGHGTRRARRRPTRACPRPSTQSR